MAGSSSNVALTARNQYKQEGSDTKRPGVELAAYFLSFRCGRQVSG